MLENAEIYNFSTGGKNYAFDVQNVWVFEVSDIAKDILVLSGNEDEIIKELSGKYSEQEIRASLDNLKKVIENGAFKQQKEEYKIPQDWRETLSGLQLHVAHACNMACKYCYASQGNYQGKESLMSWETAKKAVDFLFENSKSINLSLQFMGGEPLLNFSIIKQTIEHANKRAGKEGKILTYIINTNGTIMNDEIKKFILENRKNLTVSLSLDGQKEAHDKFRKFKDGRGSYDAIMNNMEDLIKERVCGHSATIVHGNENLAERLLWLDKFDFKKIFFTPEQGTPYSDYKLTEKDCQIVAKEYDKIFEFIQSEKVKKIPDAINSILQNITLKRKRRFYCGMGRGTFAVTPEGDFYSCTESVGKPELRMGSLNEGVVNEELVKKLLKQHNDCSRCEKCWARYLCGGGCQLYKYIDSETAKCTIFRKEAEVALKIYASREKNIVKIN